MKCPSRFGTRAPEPRDPYLGNPHPFLGGLACVSRLQCIDAGFPGCRGSFRKAVSLTGKVVPRLAALLTSLAACACLTGCFGFLKPAQETARHFVLTSLPAPATMTELPEGLAVGVRQVKLPAYLFDTSLAVRKDTNEIDYLPLIVWAERLDTGIQRALAANLATLLPTDRVRLSAWRSEDVGAEVYVSIEQFDVDTRGRGVLVARWRVLSPGGKETLKAGESRLSRQGPAPNANPSGAIATLSDLLAEQSRQLAQAITEATRARPAEPVSK
jgi:uncharacterized lipoprotein YmbA